MRNLQRSLAEVTFVAGMLVTWVAPSANGNGNDTIGRANLDG